MSENLVRLAGFVSFGDEGSKKAKAAAFFPFIFVKSEKYITPVFINHEKIHFRQQLETLFLGIFILNVIEDIYSMLFLKLQGQDRYLYRASEQEAYRNQLNLKYLEKRKIFSLFKFIKDKRKLQFIEGRLPEVIVGERWY
ncbi:MAG: hypothetical protein R3B60_01490 [Candidatus Paceibacterota bacterium]